MKRLMTLLLAGILTLSTGCALLHAEEERQENRYALYFREADLTAAAGGDALRAEYTVLDDTEEEDVQTVAAALLETLLAGPRNTALKSTIPSGAQLLSVTVDRGQAEVDFSAAYGSLSGINLALADYAVTLTLSQLPEILSVRITVRGQDLAYRDRQVFSASDVLLSPKGDVVTVVAATLHYLDENGVLVEMHRALDLYEGDTQVSAVVKALESDPEDGYYSAMPEGFRVRSAWLEENTCYVNLSSAQLKNMTRLTGLPAAIRALERSLCSLESVEEVRFLVDGEFARSYGAVNIEEPYTE